MSDTLSLREFADEIEVSPSYVTKLKQQDRLILTADGRVEVEASLQRINETAGAHGEGVRDFWRRRRQQKRSGTGSEAGAGDDRRADEPPSGEDRPDPDNEAHSKAYWDKRESRARAMLRELELAEQEGRLVDAEAVRRAGAEAGTALRAVLENAADQLAPVLASTTDEEKVRAMLTEHFDAILTEVSGKLSNLAVTQERGQ